MTANGRLQTVRLWLPRIQIPRCPGLVLERADRSPSRGVKHLAIHRLRSLCKSGRLDAIFTHQVKHRSSASEQIVGDDPAVTAPPDCFRTHNRAATFTGEFE